MTEVTISKPAAVETPEYVAAMVARAEGREVETPAPAAERPDWLPEGFDTPEQLAEAYKASVKKPDAGTATETAEAAAEVVAAAGLDMAALEAKVIENGSLDDADYEALAAKGINRAMVDSYIDGQRALGEALINRVHQHVGGKDAFETMLAWAGSGGITPAEAEAFNSVIDTGSEAQVKLALDGLKAKFAASGQNAPRLLGGGRQGGATDVYESVEQMMEDMRTTKYQRDPAFRAAVEAKLARSSIM